MYKRQVSDWYRQAMNNFWITEEINLSQDVKDYPRLLSAERSANDKIPSFLVFLDSIQTANLPNIGHLCLFQLINILIYLFQFCCICCTIKLSVCSRGYLA